MARVDTFAMPASAASQRRVSGESAATRQHSVPAKPPRSSWRAAVRCSVESTSIPRRMLARPVRFGGTAGRGGGASPAAASDCRLRRPVALSPPCPDAPMPDPPPLPTLETNAAGPASCDGCGACCRRNGSPPLLYNSGLSARDADGCERHPFRPPDLPVALIAQIDALFLGLHRGQEPPGPCCWYDAATARCRHYELRPQVCRDYERGSVACVSDRAAEATSSPRAGNGGQGSGEAIAAE